MLRVAGDAAGQRRARRGPVVPTSIRLDSRSATAARRPGQVAQLDDLGARHLDAAALGPVGEQRVALRLGGLGPVQGRVTIGLDARSARPRAASARSLAWRASRRAAASSARSASSSPRAPRAGLAGRRRAACCSSSRRCCSDDELGARAGSAACSAASRRFSARRSAAGVVGARRGVLGLGDERGDPLLPAVVPPQPLDADRIDELGNGAGGEAAAELGRRPRWPGAAARAPPSAPAARAGTA